MAIVKKLKYIIGGPKEYVLKDAQTRGVPVSFSLVDEDGENREEIEISMMQLTWTHVVLDGKMVEAFQIIGSTSDGEDVCGEYRPGTTKLDHGLGLIIHHMKVEEPRASASRHPVYQ